VFRYFSDKDELARTAIERQDAFIRPLLPLDTDAGAPLDDRIAGLVDRRLELFASIAPVARLSRTLVQAQPLIAKGLTAIRAILRQQIEELFAAELDALEDEPRSATLASLDVLCSFESVELLRYDWHLDREATAAVLAHGLRVLLIGPGTLSKA
jgi:AcrR family transcriptional regulator